MATLITWSVYLLLVGIVYCSQISLTGGYGSLPKTFKLPTKQRYQYSHHIHWTCLNSTAEDYNCCDVGYHIVCHESGPQISFGRCATFDEGKLIIALCHHYFLASSYQNITVPGLIPLPLVISEFNDSICRPMNRKGVVCSKCMDGYGLSITSYWYKCVRCPNAWYRVPLFLIIELLPITLLYLFALVFQISVTTPPIPCFTMYAQFVVLGFRYMTMNVDYEGITLDIKILQTVYGIFNLDFFKLILPHFCVSSKLQLIHIFFLGYISVFYPQLLILLTWVGFDLHNRHNRIFAWILRSLNRCFTRMRRGCNTKGDIIDVFITFFLLSYTKCVYLSFFLLDLQHNTVLDSQHQFIVSHVISVAGIDPSLTFCGKHHLPYVIFSILTLFLFILLPSLFLIFYPIRALRTCLFKFHLDFVALNIFADKLQSCYRNGLDGGRDMRCFSGIFFNLRIAVFMCQEILYFIVKLHRWMLMGITFTMISLVVALTNPYQKIYLNIFDTLLYFNLAILCFLTSSNISFPIIILFVRLLYAAPIVFIVALVLLRNLDCQLNYHCDQLKLYFHKMCHTCSMRRQQSLLLTEQRQHTQNSASTATQPRIQPGSSIEISYGSYH